MEFSGKIFKIMPLQSGESQRGPWQKQEIVLETDNGKFPKKVCITLWGDLISNNSLVEGTDISLEADVESREYNGKWYTDVKAWRVNRAENNNNSRPANNNNSNNNNQRPAYTPPSQKMENVSSNQIDDDLPF